jgi:4-amino-4-deoxy-L-arabinose transferase-like glycosyltransferase
VLDWCWQFVHVKNDAGQLLRRSRAIVALLTLALAGIVWAWARVAGGPAAGIAALVLVAFHPSLVAHGHLATTDLCAALFVLVAAWAFWHWLQAPSLARAALAASALGLAAATRITAGVVVPVFLAALLVALRRKSVPALGRSALVLLLVAALVIPGVVWAAYGFHDAPWPEELARRPRVGGTAGRLLDVFDQVHVLPAGYVGSIRFQVEHNRQGHPAYLLGERRKTGWWYYQPVAFAVKNTPGFLLALVAAALVLSRRPRPRAPVGFWLGLAFVVIVTASLARIQIGERYLLPAYPFLALIAASAVPRVLEWRHGALVLVALSLLHAGPTLLAAPGGEVSYFNLLAGGRLGGHRVLLDSNLDWGQDLPRLAAWMRKAGVASVQLAYEGADDPGRFGIAHEDLPGDHLYPARPPSVPFDGVVAVSPNLLFGLVPRLGDPYAPLRERRPDARAGVFFVYRMTAR